MQWPSHNISHWYNTIIQNIEHSQKSPIVHKFFLRVIIFLSDLHIISNCHILTFLPEEGESSQVTSQGLSMSSQVSETSAMGKSLVDITPSKGLCMSQISGLHSQIFSFCGVESKVAFFTYSKLMLMLWVWDSHFDKAECVYWDCSVTITMLMETQRYKIFGFLSGCFSCTILKGRDCPSLLFRVSFIILKSIFWCWEGLGVGGEGDNRGWDGCMASRTRWTWVWVNSGSWWWTGRPGMLWFMGSQRVRRDWATELRRTDIINVFLRNCKSNYS